MSKASAQKNIIGPRLRQARKSRTPALTQEDFVFLLEAYGMKVSQSTISKIEAQERIVLDYEVKAIGEALAVEIGWLLDEEKL